MTILEQSLCLLNGISPECEVRLRHYGILTCKQLVNDIDSLFSPAHSKRIRTSYAQYEVASEVQLVDWMVTNLPSGHRVRAIKQFFKDVLFYDIETNGLTKSANITCISTIKNGEVKTFVRNRNLHDFLKEWQQAKIIVGFNNKSFDSHMICKEFGLSSVPPQVDLMHEAAHYGLRGGLKKIEHLIGYKRKEQVCKNGEDAILLWHNYCKHGNEQSLEYLIRYNCEDVYSLIFLFNKLLHMSLENTLIVL